MSSAEQKRIQYSRDELVKKFQEVLEPPQILTKKFEKAPLCHILSVYVIRPVAFDLNPFVIHHKNKQPVVLVQKEKRVKNKNEDFNSDQDDNQDDEFETVTTDKKRAKKQTQPSEVVYDPRFPASDPSKIKVITVSNEKPFKNKKPAKNEIQQNDFAKGQTVNSTQEFKKSDKLVAQSIQAEDESKPVEEVKKEVLPVVKEEQKQTQKQNTQPEKKKQQPTEGSNEIFLAMKLAQEVKSSQQQPIQKENAVQEQANLIQSKNQKTEMKIDVQPKQDAVQQNKDQKPLKSARKQKDQQKEEVAVKNELKKQKEEEKKQENIQAEKKVQEEKKEQKKVEKLEDIFKEEKKENKPVTKKQEQPKEEPLKFDENNYMASMQAQMKRAAELSQKQDAEKKLKKAQKKQQKNE